MTKFEQWFEYEYTTAIVYCDHEKAEYLLDNKEAIQYGFETAMDIKKEITDLQLEIHVDGVKERL
jgi:hypothetical protein